jgi:hypothetical protein
MDTDLPSPRCNDEELGLRREGNDNPDLRGMNSVPPRVAPPVKLRLIDDSATKDIAAVIGVQVIVGHLFLGVAGEDHLAVF